MTRLDHSPKNLPYKEVMEWHECRKIMDETNYLDSQGEDTDKVIENIETVAKKCARLRIISSNH